MVKGKTNPNLLFLNELIKSYFWVVFKTALIFYGKGERSEPAEGWTAVARRARPRCLRRRAERIASCETARPALRAGQPQKIIG